jgi:hypothetical protein
MTPQSNRYGYRWYCATGGASLAALVLAAPAMAQEPAHGEHGEIDTLLADSAEAEASTLMVKLLTAATRMYW